MMRMPFIVFMLPLLLGVPVSGVFGQKVGLVLSGGGAKGLAHIGVLKAFEENDIPVDYIAGTSMGGMVGGFYAAGYSPSAIEYITSRSKERRDGKEGGSTCSSRWWPYH